MKKLNLGTVALAGSLAMGAAALPAAASAEMSYNVGLHSKYLLRGTGEENKTTTIQGGADYSHASGFYAGYWFSSLDYSYEATSDGKTNKNGFENDLYGGFTGEFTKGFGYDIGLIQYVYVNVDDSDLTELKAKLSFADFYVQAQYLLNDGWWGNSGDTYWTAGWSTALPENFGLALDYGYYTYDKSDTAKIGGAGTTKIDSGFRHFNVKVTKAIGKTGAEGYLQYVMAGKTRDGLEHNDSMIAGVTYGF